MISVHQLAEIISHSPKGTVLRQTSRQPGRERYSGLCPLHQERTPSFDVFVGADGAGHYYCHGCQQGGSGEWWLSKVEGRTIRKAGAVKPDPQLQQRRQQERMREDCRQLVLDASPDLPPEAEAFLGEPDTLTLLQLRLRRRLSR
jgi:DNA primase